MVAVVPALFFVSAKLLLPDRVWHQREDGSGISQPGNGDRRSRRQAATTGETKRRLTIPAIGRVCERLPD